MIATMSLSEIAADCNGQLCGDAQFNRVCTDTRKLQVGDLFIALSGEHFDGHEFICDVVDKGAAGVVVSRVPDIDIPYLLVPDPRYVFGLIARRNRRLFQGPVVALTGSTGKTTCKEMLAAILSECGQVLATQGNFNNEVGVPLTLLQLNNDHRSAVIEMGASKAGDIGYLCQFAEPTIAVVTNAMAAHIEGFGDLETVALTKGEIFERLSPDGVVIINQDDAFAKQWQVQAGNKRIITFSMVNSQADVFARNVQTNARTNLQFMLCTAEGEEQIEMALLGRHNVANALAACAAAIAAGANLQQVKAGLSNVCPVAGRLQSLTTATGNRVIDDSYNANPGSVKAAIDVLADCSKISATAELSTCLILGTMCELGEQAQQFHRDVAEYAREQGIQHLVAVGEYAQPMIDVFGQGGTAYNQLHELLPVLHEHAQTDIVLVKGSRSAHMETVIRALMDGTGAVNNNPGEH